jgi:hypothetical protein
VWSEIRRQLGLEDQSFEPGTWWCVPHEAVIREDGRLFSNKTDGDGRRVVLATAYGPNGTLFARSGSIPARYEHPAHVHPGGSSRCMLKVRGWIDLRLKVNVSIDFLGMEHYSCEEPTGSPLLRAIAGAMRP